MRHILRTYLLAATVVAALATSGQAAPIFSSSFTGADGFMNGTINFGPDNPDSVVGQGTYTVDASGTGTLNNTGTAFTRALFGFTFGVVPDPIDESVVNGLVAGEAIEIEATGLNFAVVAGGGTRNLGVFGLSNIDNGNILGGTSLASGVQFTSDGSTIWLDTNPNFAPSLGSNTGVDNGTSFNYLQRHVAVGGGIFDIEHYINGSLLTTATGVTPDFSKSSTDVTGHIQDFGQAGATSVDALRLEIFPIPEPGSLVLLGLAGFGVWVQRHR